MTQANKLSETEVERVDAVDKPATGLKFLIRKAAATGAEIQVGDALPGNLAQAQGAETKDGAELADGSDLVQKIAKAVAAELAPGLDKLAEAIENAGIVTKVEKTEDKPEAKAPVSKQAQGDDAATTTRTAVKKRGEGLFTNIVFGK